MRTTTAALAGLLGACAACSTGPSLAPLDDAGGVLTDASRPDAAAADAAPEMDAGPPPADWLLAGGATTCASRAGRVFCWGRSWSGEDWATPTELPELAGARALAVGAGHACAVLGDGQVACAGDNRGGQLGLGATGLLRRDAFEPVVGAPRASHVAVSQGGLTACALAVDGSVWCWGDDSLGQTGSPIPSHAPGSVAPQQTPARVDGVTGAVQLEMGQYQSCARLADGRVRCWGYDWFGALGRGAAYTGGAHAEPADLEGVEDAISLAIDGNGGCVLRESGEVACWGGQVHQYPGYDASTDDSCPVVVEQVCWRGPRPLALPPVTALHLGGGAGCVEGETASCFGRTLDGLVGMDDAPRDATLAMGLGHLCAMTSAGEVSCRGRGEEGQLGDGRATSTSEWVGPIFP